MTPDHDELEALVSLVLSWTGYRPDPNHAAAVRRVVGEHVRSGATVAGLLQKATQHDPELMASFVQAVSVPETYFFRQPEHFEWLADEGPLRFAAFPRIRAWSAGCATGEEAYSLAACLLATATPGTPIEVLGTDIVPTSLDVARRGLYGPWSYRLSGPILYPVCGRFSDRHAKVLEDVAAVTRFEVHNLLGAPPGRFDVIFCRNVLLYFSEEATRTLLDNIANALAPDGVAFFGTLDVTGTPDGLTRLGGAELSAFVRQDTPISRVIPRRASTRPPRRPTLPPPREVARDETMEVTMHLRVLASIERGDRRGAEQELSRLRQKAPDYLPGLFEQALLLVRHGEPERAMPPMRELLQRLESLPADTMLAGPEHLPVSYYQVAARAFLSSRPGGAAGESGGGR
jgi:chemotaxis protein methyltransferase CheR